MTNKVVTLTVPKPTKTGKSAVRTLYKFNGSENAPECKTPQMKALITTVMEANKDELASDAFTSQDLVALAVKKGALSTRQDPLRIFRFYAKRLTEEGYFSKA